MRGLNKVGPILNVKNSKKRKKYLKIKHFINYNYKIPLFTVNHRHLHYFNHLKFKIRIKEAFKKIIPDKGKQWEVYDTLKFGYLGFAPNP